MISGSIPRPDTDVGMELSEGVKRNISEVADLIRQLLTNQFGAVELRYSELEDYHSQKLTQETLHTLLKS